MDENTQNINNNNDDDYIIGRGFNLNEEEIIDRPEKKHKKGNSAVKSIVWIVSIVIVSIALAVGIIYAGADFLGLGFGRGNDCVLEIKEGTPTVTIAKQLKDCGAVKIPMLFRVYAKLTGYENQFKYGVYTFNTEAGYEAISEMLIEDGAKAETVEIKIPDMATIDEIAVLLSDNGVCSKSDFYDAVDSGEYKFDFIEDIPSEKVHYRLEGYLYPDTYSFYKYDDSKECAYLAVKKMLENLDSKLSDELKNDIKNSEYSFHEIMTLSSIVASESANADVENQSKVAAVFYNRLTGKNWDGPKRLQSDPSTYYRYGNGKYDTYKTEGLPPGPIGSPNIKSITATVNPAENFAATYFVTDANGDFYFNETLAEHNKTIATLKKQGLWLKTNLGNR